MEDKLTEIMAWKRREIAPRLRPVSESDLEKLNASLPRIREEASNFLRTFGIR